MDKKKVLDEVDTLMKKAQKHDVKSPAEFAKIYKEQKDLHKATGVSEEEVNKQVDAIDKFQKGEMSYSQMRSMAG